MERIYSLDLIRFFAALVVVLYHYSAFGYNLTGERIDVIAPFTKYGYMGVELFFMISGFVVLMSALGRTPRQFFESRFVRVVPMFWIACLITYGITALAQDPRLTPTPDLLAWNLSLATISPAQMLLQKPFLDGVYWTLALETTFYVLVWVALATGLTKRIRPLLYGWLVVALLGPLLPDNLVGKVLSGLFITRYAAYFIAGGLFYLIWKDRWVRPLDVVALLSCWGLSMWLAVRDGADMAGYIGLAQEPQTLALIVTAIFGLFAVVASGRLPEGRFQRWAWLGALTYPLYLLHHNIGFSLINKLKLLIPGELAICVMLAVILPVAWAAHRWLEVPFTQRVKAVIAQTQPRTASTRSAASRGD